MKTILIAVLLGVTFAGVEGEVEGDRSAVESAIRLYHSGADEPNIPNLEKAFHDKFRLLVAVDGKLSEIKKETYINLVELWKIGGKPRDLTINLIDVSGHSAIAQVQLSNDKVVFQDFLTLVRDGEAWQIISNAPHIYPRGGK